MCYQIHLIDSQFMNDLESFPVECFNLYDNFQLLIYDITKIISSLCKKMSALKLNPKHLDLAFVFFFSPQHELSKIEEVLLNLIFFKLIGNRYDQNLLEWVHVEVHCILFFLLFCLRVACKVTYFPVCKYKFFWVWVKQGVWKGCLSIEFILSV